MRNVHRYDPEGRPIFVTQVTRARKPLLCGHESLVLKILAELRSTFEVKVFAHVILPDHFHLILGSHEPVGRFMQSLKLRFIRRANVGPLWQDRFYDHIVRDEQDLRNHLDYVHLNPVKHGWVTAPEAYEYSSYRQYLRRGWYLPGWGISSADPIKGWELE